MAPIRHCIKTDNTKSGLLEAGIENNVLSVGKNIQVDSDTLQLSKMHWRLRDVLIRYLDGDSLVDFHCNKSILAIQAKYFMSALVTFPGENQCISMIDLSQIPFDGHIFKIILESFFRSQSDGDFELWTQQGIFGKLFYAAEYFAFDSFCNASRNYLSCRAFNALSSLKTPLEIWEKIHLNNLLQILVQEHMENSETAKSFETFLRLYLISDLKSFIFSIPVSFLCRILKIGLEYNDEKSALLIYIDAYKLLDDNDKKELKSFILCYFDTKIIMQLGEALLLDHADYEILNSKTVTGRLGHPLQLSKILEFKNRDFKFIEFDFEYGGHRMLLLLRISRTDSKYLECFLYRDIIQMHDCIPEFEFTLSDSQDRVLVSRQVLKCPAYIQHTRIRMENKRPVAHCGWSKLIRRSELKSNSRYHLSLLIVGLSALDQ